VMVILGLAHIHVGPVPGTHTGKKLMFCRCDQLCGCVDVAYLS
jgi:hypothetical protein